MDLRPVAMGATGKRILHGGKVKDRRLPEQLAAEALALLQIADNALDVTKAPWYDGGDGGDADADASLGE